MQDSAFVMQLSPILEQCPQSGGTEKRDAAHFHRDSLGSGGDRVKQSDLELIRSFAVNPASDDEIVSVAVCVFLDDHEIT